jgi:hypothetical protein
MDSDGGEVTPKGQANYLNQIVIMIRFFRYLPLLLLCTLTVAIGQAQNPPASKPPSELEKIIAFGDQGFAMVMLDDLEQPRRLLLRLFDNEEQLISEREVDLLRDRGLLSQFEGAFAWNGQLCLVTSLYYPGPKRNHLIFRKFSLPDLVESEAELIDEAYTPQYSRIPFGFSTSKDQQYIMFYSWTYTLPEDPAKLNIKVFNPAMEEVWSQRYLLPFKNQTLYIFNCAINTQGQAFIYCENYRGNPGRNIDVEKIDYFILRADQGNENLVKYDLNPTTGQVITGLNIQMDSTDAIVGAALLQDERRKMRHGGIYLFRIPPDGKSIQRSSLPFSDDMYKERYPYAEKESVFSANRHRFSNFFIDYIFRDSTGNLVLVGEYRREDPNMWDIEFNDLLVLKVSSDLNRMIWARRIPKRQNGVQGNWSLHSYKAFHKKGNYFFLPDR